MSRLSLLITVSLALVVGLAVSSAYSGCALPAEPAAPARLKVVTSTSLLTYIVQRVGGDRVDVVNIVPPAQHPGDFDASPRDIRRLAEADLFLLHGWPGESYAPGLIEAVANPRLSVVPIEVPGNWMTPSVQVEATELVAAALSRADADNEARYRKAAEEYKDAAIAKSAEIQFRLRGTGVSGTPVLSSFWQAGFAEWAGLWVIATYGPAELTPQSVRKLVDEGREARVRLVIDNLHSGRDAGKGIAEELDCARVILSNFPGAFDDTETWEEAIERNIELILEALVR